MGGGFPGRVVARVEGPDTRGWVQVVLADRLAAAEGEVGRLRRQLQGAASRIVALEGERQRARRALRHAGADERALRAIRGTLLGLGEQDCQVTLDRIQDVVDDVLDGR